jgi:UDP-2,4-diacetamido-2,4,6-trideoxy-beta-L-altropyranose hydrolase
MSNIPSIIFRADGDNNTGLGHMVRSAALAGMLNEQYNCILATRCHLESLLEELKGNFSRIINLPEMDIIEEARHLSTFASSKDLLILDGYHFDSVYQQAMADQGLEFFCIDDIHAYDFSAKVIINHSGGLTPLDYHSLELTQFFLGPRFALLRKPFLEAAKNKRDAVRDKNCFICFGGADPGNKTMEILKDLNARQDIHFHHFHVVTGPAYAYQDELQEMAATHPNITLYNALSPERMIEVMQQCSFAICSPSGVMYEYLTVGGIVFLEQIADNQKDVIRYFTEEGLAFRFADLGKINSLQIENALTRSAEYFDGRSGERFHKILGQYFDGRKLTVRKARITDLECCFNWVNDAEVRMQSYNQHPIAMETHGQWFRQKLEDPSSYYYLLEMDGNPVAQIRFQIQDNEAVLGYLVDSSIRSKGLGTTILGKGIEQFVKDYQKPVHIVGYVKRTNIPSQRSFERLAFYKEDTDAYMDSYKYTMIYGH